MELNERKSNVDEKRHGQGLMISLQLTGIKCEKCEDEQFRLLCYVLEACVVQFLRGQGFLGWPGAEGLISPKYPQTYKELTKDPCSRIKLFFRATMQQDILPALS